MLYRETLDTLPLNLYFAEQIKTGEAQSAKKLGIEMYQLMEKAGRAVFDCILANFSKATRICVLAGNGNNGGDAYVVARLALLSKLPVSLYCSDPNRSLKGDAETARQSFFTAGGKALHLSDLTKIAEPDQPSVVIDGLLGTGFSGVLREEIKQTVEIVNRWRAQVIAIDLPTGLNADTGKIEGLAIRANYTVTMVALKAGHFTADGPDVCGHLLFAGLGIDQTFERLTKPCAELSRFETVTKLSKRRYNSHKGSHGHVLCIGGNRGMAGAILLAGKAALRSGAGKVTVITHPDNVAIIAQAVPELMVFAYRQDNSDILNQKLPQADSVCFGPGLGQDDWAKTLYRHLLTEHSAVDLPLVIDADGLNLLAQQKGKLPKNLAQNPLVITPHPLEAAKLLGRPADWVNHQRYQAVQKLVEKFNAISVLKGTGSLVSGQTNTSVNCSGNPGMATAGMGDVLTGVVATFVANSQQSQSKLFENVKNAVFLHGLAGDYAAKNGEIGIIATDVIDCLPKAIAICSR